MLKTEAYNYTKAVFAGSITAVAFIYTIPMLAWFCMVPLFIAFGKTGIANVFKISFIYALTIALFLFLWMPGKSSKFTGAGISYGVIAFVGSSLLFSLYYTLPLICHKLLNTEHKAINVWLNGASMAAIWVLAEALFNQIFSAVPFFDFRIGHALAKNLYGIQYVSLFGVGVLSFVIVWINYILADIWIKGKFRAVLIPITVVLFFYLGGYFIHYSFLRNSKSVGKINIATVRPNFSAEVKWDEKNGNSLIKELLSIQRNAIASGAEVVVWTESTVPWSYAPNDDFVKEITRASAASGSLNLLGIATAVEKENNLYNSVYGIMPNGSIAGRYDKQELLSFIETPLCGLIIPFAYSPDFYLKKGPNKKPIGKAGMLLCNEVSVVPLARNNVKNGAQYLINMGNDGWVANTYLVEQHFINARLRAVENRRDMVVNNENGISGLVRASGDIATVQKDDRTTNIAMQAELRDQKSFYTANPYLMMLMCMAIVALHTIIKSIYFLTKNN